MENFGIASVAAIIVICYVVGMAVKATSLDNKWIPIICAVVGAVLGVVGMYAMPEFPATDIINAVAVGIVSGLSATGINQVVKQMGGTNGNS